jgi:acyl dehydratase
MTTAARYWDDAREGDEAVTPSVTVTGEMIDQYADVSGDHTLLHVDEEYARRSHFGQRVAHGLLGLAVADGLKCQADYRFLPGMSLGWTWDFLKPIYIGDTLHVRFRVTGLRASRSKPEWGIVSLPCELVNQHGEVVQRGEHKLMIPRRPAAAAAPAAGATASASSTAT